MHNNQRRFTLRVDEDIINELEKISKINMRSINSEVNIALKKYIEIFKKDLDINLTP